MHILTAASGMTGCSSVTGGRQWVHKHECSTPGHKRASTVGHTTHRSPQQAHLQTRWPTAPPGWHQRPPPPRRRCSPPAATARSRAGRRLLPPRPARPPGPAQRVRRWPVRLNLICASCAASVPVKLGEPWSLLAGSVNPSSSPTTCLHDARVVHCGVVARQRVAHRLTDAGHHLGWEGCVRLLCMGRKEAGNERRGRTSGKVCFGASLVQASSGGKAALACSCHGGMAGVGRQIAWQDEHQQAHVKQPAACRWERPFHLSQGPWQTLVRSLQQALPNTKTPSSPLVTSSGEELPSTGGCGGTPLTCGRQRAAHAVSKGVAFHR